MRWLTSLRAEDSTDTDRVDETACEPVQSAIGPERSEVTEPATDADESDHHDPPKGIGGRISWSKALAYGLIPALALQLASAAGYLKWQDGTAREAHAAGVVGCQPDACRGPGVCRPGRDRRAERTDQQRIQRSGHPRQGRRPVADLAIRPGVIRWCNG